ncbi:MAG: hypothetical protein NT069_25340 [Planctomycetota bacterium]|nr:hypothetical protein [Planctomycetota bacterium]
MGLLSNLCLPWLFPGTKLLNVLPNSNFLALGLGGLLAMRPVSPTLIRRLLAWSVFALPIFVIVAAAMVAGVRFRGIGQLRSLSMIVGFFWLIGRASVGFTGWVGRVLTLPILVFLGRISYGIYILHNFSDWPVNLVCQRVFGTTDLTLFQRIPLKTIATLVGANLSWFCLERPLSRLKSRIPYRRDITPGTH